MAVGVWLTGSTAAGIAGTMSDLDIVVVATQGPAFRETFVRDDCLIELFVHTEESVAEWIESEAREYRCTLAHMVASGMLLIGSDRAVELQRRALQHLEDGPSERTQEEIDGLRYHLSASLDDLAESTDADEAAFIIQDLVTLASELELATRGSWTGRGKWLHRWLMDASSDVAHGLAAALTSERSNRVLVSEVASDVLDRAGGRLQEGYRIG